MTRRIQLPGNPVTRDYSTKYRDYAKFCPAVSEMFARFVSNKNPKRPSPVSQHDLDFLQPTSNIYYIPYALYSAGQAAKSQGASHRKDMITGRNRQHSVILGDSGGYQIQTNAIKFKGDETRERMMRWLENNCNWSMILDFPTGGINMGNVDQHTTRLKQEGHDLEAFCAELGWAPNDIQKLGIATCLKQTLINNDYFVANRAPGATNFLNVVQGRNNEESSVWYQAVKHYDFEGWSLAGPHKENFSMTMRRLIDMKYDGLLINKKWMHFLGVGKLANGCAYTTMQRCIREDKQYGNSEFTMSYDVSSPFTTAAFGNLFLGYTLDKNAWTIQSDKLDGRDYLPGGKLAGRAFLEEIYEKWIDKGLEGQEHSMFVESNVGKHLRMDQVCVNEDPKFTSTWDVVTYALMMNHNLQTHLEAVFRAQELYDSNDVSRVPLDLMHLKNVIPEIWNAPSKEAAYTLIANNDSVLNCLAGDAAGGGVQDNTVMEFALTSQHNQQVIKLHEHNKTKKTETFVVNDLFSKAG